MVRAALAIASLLACACGPAASPTGGESTGSHAAATTAMLDTTAPGDVDGSGGATTGTTTAATLDGTSDTDVARSG